MPDICNLIGQNCVHISDHIFLPCKYQWNVQHVKSRREKIIRSGNKKFENIRNNLNRQAS